MGPDYVLCGQKTLAAEMYADCILEIFPSYPIFIAGSGVHMSFFSVVSEAVIEKNIHWFIA